MSNDGPIQRVVCKHILCKKVSDMWRRPIVEWSEATLICHTAHELDSFVSLKLLSNQGRLASPRSPPLLLFLLTLLLSNIA